MANPPNLEDLIETWSPRIQQAFRDAIYQIQDAAQIDRIAQALAAGDVNAALRAAGIDPTAFSGLDQAIEAAFRSGGVATAAGLPAGVADGGHKLKIMFDARNTVAENWLRLHSSALITEIVADQQTAVRNFLEASLAKGENPKVAALDLVGRVSTVTRKREGGVIGLTSTQEAWARNYTDEVATASPKALERALRDKRFDRAIQKAIKTGEPIPADTQAAMVRSYRNRALRYRGETIGRTEALTSLHKAADLSTRQAIAKGQFTEKQVRKVWRSAGDDRVRETHRALNGESVGLDELFQSPSGAQLAFPGDPSAPAAEVIQCRCWIQFRVDSLANIK